MIPSERTGAKPGDRPVSLDDMLMRLDLATEVLEGMDELNVETRTELRALMDDLERQIKDED